MFQTSSGFHYCQEGTDFSVVSGGGQHPYNHVHKCWLRVCRLSFGRASLWLPLSDARLDPDSRQAHSFKLLLISPTPTYLLGGRRWERRKVWVHWLWMGIRCTSLPLCPQLLTRTCPSSDLLECSACEPCDNFHPQPSLWEETDA